MHNFIFNLIDTTIGNTSCRMCNYRIDEYRDALFPHFNIPLPNELRNAVTKRKAEFLAGRIIAGYALRRSGSSIDQVRIGDNRCPIWPSGYIGSISHTDSRAIAVATLKNLHGGIGVDRENLLTKRTVLEIGEHILSRREIQELRHTNKMKPELLYTLGFSAKESLFKALYPQIRSYFGFDVAQLDLIDDVGGTFQIQIIQDLTPKIPKGTTFNGHYTIDHESITTLVKWGT